MSVIDRERIIRILAHPYCVATAFFLFFIAVYLHFYNQNSTSQLKEANTYYLEGERATDIATRNSAFNRALASLLKIEENYNPRFGNGILYYDIGNTFFQLEDYPMAVLYYHKSLNLRPLDRSLRNNLNVTLKKLDLPPPRESTPLEKVFFFHTLFPLPLRLQLFFFSAAACLTLSSAYLLQASKKVKFFAASCAIFSLIFLLSLATTQFIEKPEAIVVVATNLYRGAGKQFATVTPSPIKPGSKVTATRFDENSGWIKIISDDGEIGFVPSKTVKLIDP